MSLNEYLEQKKVGGEPQASPAPVEPGVEPQEPVAPEPEPGPGPQPEPAVNQPAAQEPIVPQPQFDVENFNSFFGTPYKGEGEVKELLNRAAEYESIQKKFTELETSYKSLEEKNKELEAGTDPMQYFSSPDAYVAEQIKKQMPDVDPAVIVKLLSHEKSRIADFDLLAYDYLLNSPDTIGGIDGARECVAKKYGIDPNDPAEEWERVTKNMMMADARAVERRIAQMKGEIKVPELPTPEAIQAQRAEAVQKNKAAWAPYVNDISGFDKLSVPGDDGKVMLEMEVPKAFRDTLPEFIDGVIEQTGVVPSPETLKDVIEYRNKMFVYDYLPKILEVYGNNIRSELEEKYHRELNNVVPPNSNIAPASPGPQSGDGFRQAISSTQRSKLGK
jgi:hypothetical protein